MDTLKERERLKIAIRLNKLFQDIEQIKSWEFGYFEVRQNVYNDVSIYFEIKLEMSKGDYVAYDVMNKLMGEKPLKTQIKIALTFSRSYDGLNWDFHSQNYYFKIRLCDKIEGKVK